MNYPGRDNVRGDFVQGGLCPGFERADRPGGNEKKAKLQSAQGADNPRYGGAVVRRRTRDRKVAGSTPGRGAIKSTRSTQPSIPPA